MRNVLTMLVSVLLLASCATPKYSYHFDYYDYNSGKKQNIGEPNLSTSLSGAELRDDLIEQNPVTLNKEELIASAHRSMQATDRVVDAPGETTMKYSELSRSEKREFRKTLKAELKKVIKAKKEGDGSISEESKVMDHNLKMAIIFGAVAVTLSFFGGVNSVFWILSVVSLVIAVVFFIKWIAEM